jgi:hypothetical protein
LHKTSANLLKLNNGGQHFTKSLASLFSIGFSIDLIMTIKSPFENYNNRWSIIKYAVLVFALAFPTFAILFYRKKEYDFTLEGSVLLIETVEGVVLIYSGWVSFRGLFFSQGFI